MAKDYNHWISRHPCSVCGGGSYHPESGEWLCDPAHTKSKGAGGILCIPLCRECHTKQHSMGVKQFQLKYRIDMHSLAERMHRDFMATGAWKDAERRVAKVIGGKRKSRGADFGQSDADIEHEWLSAEVKYRKEIPKYLDEWLKQAEGYSISKLPIVVLLEKGMDVKNGVVFMRLKHFNSWFGGFKKKAV